MTSHIEDQDREAFLKWGKENETLLTGPGDTYYTAAKAWRAALDYERERLRVLFTYDLTGPKPWIHDAVGVVLPVNQKREREARVEKLVDSVRCFVVMTDPKDAAWNISVLKKSLEEWESGEK